MPLPSFLIAFLIFAQFLFLSSSSLERHPLHLSQSVIEYYPENGVARATVHLFIDDLEYALTKAGAENPHLGTAKESAVADQHLEAYFQKHFRFVQNGKAVRCQLLGKELSEDHQALWCYLEFSPLAIPGKLSVRCSLLTEIYRDQKNMVHLVVPGTGGQSALLSRNRSAAEFVMKP